MPANKCFYLFDPYSIIRQSVYPGDEDAGIAAGALLARHFRLTDTAGNLPDEHPPYEVWCTTDGDFLLVKASVGGCMRTRHESTELWCDG